MEIVDYSKVKRFDSFHADNLEKANIPDAIWPYCNNHVISINDAYYIWKYDSLAVELIGAYLSSILGLESASYSLALYGDKPFVVSKVFFEEGFHYFMAGDFDGAMELFGKPVENIKTSFYCFVERLHLLPKQVLDKMLKLIAIDLKMGQVDRNEENIIFKRNKVTGELDLAPAFDFTNAYVSSSYYKNPFLFLRLNHKSLADFIREFPKIREYIDALQSVSMDVMMDGILEKSGVAFEKAEIAFYQSFDKGRSRMLKKFC